MSDDDSVASVSLKTGHSLDNGFWSKHSDTLLRFTIRIAFTFLIAVIVIEMFLFPVSYSAATLDAIITPYPSSDFTSYQENQVLNPCVYPRLYRLYDASDILCDYDEITLSYCPEGWSCSIVANEETQEQTFVCLNNAYSCGDLHYCSDYINELTPADTGAFPYRPWGVDIPIGSYASSMTFLLAALAIAIITWGCLEALLWEKFADSVANIFPMAGPKQCVVNFVSISSRMPPMKFCVVNNYIIFFLLVFGFML
jgi:hypothetical protein